MKSGCESSVPDPAGEVTGTSSSSLLHLADESIVGIVNKGTENGKWNKLDSDRNQEY